jgi:hypothetical protein
MARRCWVTFYPHLQPASWRAYDHMVR